MEKYNFLPLWYRKKVRKNNKFKFKVAIYILMIMIIVSGMNTFMNFKHVKNLDKELQFYSGKEKLKEEHNKSTKQQYAINSLNKIIPYIKENSNLKLSNITIENKKVSIKMHNSIEKDAKNFIEQIEKKNKFKIKDLKYIKEEDKVNLEVCLEV